ncbi:carbohydrate kinase [Pontibacter diazotrophicus]|uniref:Carbohydrate kinase n=1 Tax=Pontibacter diazotrophicus TaxID=1400979 RepID=A0A3D8L0W8_9BACT|nr:carbohydrate kinase [Pontibacter diazotrophicus]RDV11078.1 carbohydrate kinase [Pontibacter diazotrophicus]
MNTKITCFGEMLWDILPSGKLPGGAPMNVAIHLQYQGFTPIVISCVGRDELGKGLLDYLQQKGLATQWVQEDEEQQTGVVMANVSNRSEVSYDIVQPVAWDYIQMNDDLRQLGAESDFFIYGSLAARSEPSRHTLLSLLEVAKVKVFDVNLRPPHYSREVLEPLLKQADIVKMNHHELMEIAGWHQAFTDEKAGMEFLKEQYALQTVIVTRGENGAAVLSDEGYFEQAGYAVEVEDTIGSGDAFLASFLGNHIKGETYPEALQQACAMGALVATHKGATPEIAPEKVTDLING